MTSVNYHDIEISDDVIAAVDAGRKIEAIKMLREQAGLDLTDAKHVADHLLRERPGAAPAMAEEGGAGSMIRMVIVIGIILAAYFYFSAG